MSSWIWVLIPIVAIIGSFVIDYQKNKLKWQNQTSSNEKEIDELNTLIQQLKKRIENLEAIAAGDPEPAGGAFDPFEADMCHSIKKENELIAAEKAKNKGD